MPLASSAEGQADPAQLAQSEEPNATSASPAETGGVAQQPAPDANAADSSTTETTNDQDANQPKSTLEAIEEALSLGKEKGQSSSPEGKPESEDDGAKPNEAGEQPGQEGEDADKDLPFHTHPRWQEVTGENKRLKEENTKLQQEREVLNQSHEVVTQLHTFMDGAQLDHEEVSLGLEIMAMMKSGDPAKALDVLMPYVEKLQLASGRALPPDLAAQVDAGEISEALARELSQARSREALAISTAERARAETQKIQDRSAQDQATQAETAAKNSQTAVANWEAKWKSDDPDFGKKAKRVGEIAQLALYKDPSIVQSPERAVALMDKALELVNAEMEALAASLAKPEPINPVTTQAAVNAPGALEPKTTMDIIDGVTSGRLAAG